MGLGFLRDEDDEPPARRSRGRSGRSRGRGPRGDAREPYDPPRNGGNGRGGGNGGRNGRRGRRRRRKRGGIAPFIAIVVLLAILGGAGYGGYKFLTTYVVPPDYEGAGTGEVAFTIKPKENATQIGQNLVKQDVVASVRAFTRAVDQASMGSALQPGEYKLRKRMAAAEAVKALDPKLRQRIMVTIPEGKRLAQVVKILAEQTGKPEEEFKRAAQSRAGLGLPSYARRLEGYAFPDTYEIEPKETPKDILRDMVKRFDQAAENLDLVEGAKRVKLKPEQVVVVASIVQAEAGRKEDMGKIARVIYNRLARTTPPQKLEMDSTVMYATGKYGIRASHSDTQVDSPYNTYKYKGLPPGAITNPGEDALKAALNPAAGNWLYFVTTDPQRGITKFTHDWNQHQRNIQELNRNTRGTPGG
ncbi:endolytic transglycosylase MltG [Bailinhaonella thermotolerans]|uniref:Endolytic murein transglycosylase n=2 Tax=Bailinhaonella thermotolerans TaxID=1070861 RepID=A0A3A4AXY1_9ACTN|nr:endolytic transglycosylase MltG [Bailinhaonella thermotolerans]